MTKEYTISAGTMQEGLDIDLVAYSGLQLTVDQYDTLHDEMTDIELLFHCESYHLNPHEDEDVVANDDGDFFYLATYDEDALKSELRVKIQETLDLPTDIQAD
ncbi:hypothetical protein N8473_00915 [Amylibacter sp.]|nr:hypothetical protein [Amylibacter sp.]